MRQNVMIMSGIYLRGGVMNESIENVQHAAKSQQAYPIHYDLDNRKKHSYTLKSNIMFIFL
jgi:hypothetical protein